MEPSKNGIEELVLKKNSEKFLFTAGPASLLLENLTELGPCFGRGDNQYLTIEDEVLTRLKSFSNHKFIARMQGSGSLALEICAQNFLFGNILIVNTGFYSNRLKELAEKTKILGREINKIDIISWHNLNEVVGKYDWIWACVTETSIGLKLPIKNLAMLAKRVDAKLMLDATASIGLESDHEMADVISYSSCKGLFGLTGAAFIAFNQRPSFESNSFYLNLNTHLEKKITGPYHAILSMIEVLRRHDYFRESVVVNKERFIKLMEKYLTVPYINQPLLCTHVNIKIKSQDPRAILYETRGSKLGSIVCHLGEVHLGRKASGRILDVLEEEI